MSRRDYAIAAVVIVGLGLCSFSQAGFVSPDSSKQSGFLRAFDSSPFPEPYQQGCGIPVQTSKGSSSTSGYRTFNSAKDVRFTRTLEASICGDPADLKLRLFAALSASGCEASAVGASEISYTCGQRSAGLITVDRSNEKIRLSIDERWRVFRIFGDEKAFAAPPAIPHSR